MRECGSNESELEELVSLEFSKLELKEIDPSVNRSFKFAAVQKIVVFAKSNINEKSFLDLIYPFGAIYMSVDNTDPGELFGGTWTSFSGASISPGYAWKRVT